MKLALLLGSWSHYQQSFHVSHNFLYPSSSLLPTSDTTLREEWCKTYLSEGPSTTKLGRTKQNEILNSSFSLFYWLAKSIHTAEKCSHVYFTINDQRGFKPWYNIEGRGRQGTSNVLLMWPGNYLLMRQMIPIMMIMLLLWLYSVVNTLPLIAIRQCLPVWFAAQCCAMASLPQFSCSLPASAQWCEPAWPTLDCHPPLCCCWQESDSSMGWRGRGRLHSGSYYQPNWGHRFKCHRLNMTCLNLVKIETDYQTFTPILYPNCSDLPFGQDSYFLRCEKITSFSAQFKPFQSEKLCTIQSWMRDSFKEAVTLAFPSFLFSQCFIIIHNIHGK